MDYLEKLVLGKNVFLSGPMSDDEVFFHADMFIKAHALVKAAGAKRIFDPTLEWLKYRGPRRSHEQWMCECIHELITCNNSYEEGSVPMYDMLLSLPGWEDSDGASVEREVAKACGIKVYDFPMELD